MLEAMEIELLYWEGCPSHPKALADLQAVIAELGLAAEVKVREVSSEEQAARERFVGSPTIRVNGKDIVDPGAQPPIPSISVKLWKERWRSKMAKIEQLEPMVGRKAPSFSLPDTEGHTHSPGGAPVTVVVFTCNHCPYALAWHRRLVAAASDYRDQGVKTLFVNPNDADRYPADSPEAMAKRVAAGEFDGHPYLRDETQEVARAYDAKVTPDVFVIDGEGLIRYRGAPDEDYEREELAAAWLRQALDAVLAGRDPEPAETAPVGCTIKWRP